MEKSKILVKIEINGNGGGDYREEIAISNDYDKLVEFVKNKYGVGIGKENGFENFWDGYFEISDSEINIL